jgi:hypothetical protein
VPTKRTSIDCWALYLLTRWVNQTWQTWAICSNNTVHECLVFCAIHSYGYCTATRSFQSLPVGREFLYKQIYVIWSLARKVFLQITVRSLHAASVSVPLSTCFIVDTTERISTTFDTWESTKICRSCVILICIRPIPSHLFTCTFAFVYMPTYIFWQPHPFSE